MKNLFSFTYNRSFGITLIGLIFLVLAGIIGYFNYANMYELEDDFSLSLEVVSFDNFYDVEAEVFTGEQQSVTDFSYKVIQSQDELRTVENRFDVETLAGEPIVNIVREYYINAQTGGHDDGLSHKSGFLFGPRMRGFKPNYPDKAGFEYWHVNYNAPIFLSFIEEQTIFGQAVYVYEGHAVVDQTTELGNIPGVGEQFGMKLYVFLRLYIDPVTGQLVSYEDKATAFFTDIDTGEELYPWNSFRNSVSPLSQELQANHIALYQQREFFRTFGEPGILIILALLCLFHRALAIALGLSNNLAGDEQKRKYVLPLLFSLVITSGSFFFAYIVNDVLHQQYMATFQNETIRITQQIENRLALYENALQGGIGLFSASNDVTRDEWKTYVDSTNVMNNTPGIQGIGYAVVVPSSTKEAFEQQVREEGFPDFVITPAGERELITSILYLEPFDARNQRAFGYDMFSESNRRLAMSYARDSGETGLSGKITLLQETNTDIQPGFLMYVPLYDQPELLKTVSDRREHLKGFVYAPFRAGEFMKSVLFDNPTTLGIQLYDGLQETGLDKSLYQSAQVYTKDLVHYDEIRFGNRVWTIEYSTPPHYAQDIIRQYAPQAIIVLGVILGILLYIVMYVSATQRERAISIAREMTKNISRLQVDAEQRAQEAERLNRLMVDRENAMAELKKNQKKKRDT